MFLKKMDPSLALDELPEGATSALEAGWSCTAGPVINKLKDDERPSSLEQFRTAQKATFWKIFVEYAVAT